MLMIDIPKKALVIPIQLCRKNMVILKKTTIVV